MESMFVNLTACVIPYLPLHTQRGSPSSSPFDFATPSDSTHTKPKIKKRQ